MLVVASVAVAGGPLPVVPDLAATVRADRPAPAIINGEAAADTDWPNTGGLIVSGRADVYGFGEVEGRGFMCSSTLIAPDVVLTAAHCVDVDGLIEAAAVQGVTVQSYEDLQMGWSRQARLDAWDLAASAQYGVLDWPTDAVLSEHFVAHPDFDLFSLQVGLADNHDLGLVFLDEPVFDVPFAILPTSDEAAELAEGDEVVVVGWGQQQQDPIPGTFAIKRMGTSDISAIAAPEFQVGADFAAVRKCHGDSGGPTFREYPDTVSSEAWRLVGVTSHSWDATTDCRVTGGVDTRVDAHLDWIDRTMRDACADGTRSWCEFPGLILPPDADGNFPFEVGPPTGDGSTDGEEKKGCGCAAPGAPLAGSLTGLAALLVVRRRRR